MPHGRLIAEFTRRLGLIPDDAARESCAAFALPGLGRLTLEASANREELLVSLALPLPFHDTGKLMAALALCRPGESRPFALSCGLAQDSLILVSRQKVAPASAALLENHAIFLINRARTLGFAGA
jgi:type III secretion system chaperone SycN